MEVGHWMSSNRPKLNADRTELLWAGSRRSWSLLGDCGPALQFGVDTVVSSNHVRVLGVTLSSDLTIDKHVSNAATATCPAVTGLGVSRDACPCLRHVRIDYCNALLAGAPKATTDKLQVVQQ